MHPGHCPKCCSTNSLNLTFPRKQMPWLSLLAWFGKLAACAIALTSAYIQKPTETYKETWNTVGQLCLSEECQGDIKRRVSCWSDQGEIMIQENCACLSCARAQSNRKVPCWNDQGDRWLWSAQICQGTIKKKSTFQKRFRVKHDSKQLRFDMHREVSDCSDSGWNMTLSSSDVPGQHQTEKYLIEVTKGKHDSRQLWLSEVCKEVGLVLDSIWC